MYRESRFVFDRLPLTSMSASDFHQEDEFPTPLDVPESPAWKPERLAPRCEEARLWEIVRELDLEPYRRLANASGRESGFQVACVSTGRAQASESLARATPDAHVTVWYLDQFQSYRAIEHIGMVENTNPMQLQSHPTLESFAPLICQRKGISSRYYR